MESKRGRSTLRFKGGKKLAVKVAINGLGRIGRAALKLILDTPKLELVAVNDIGSLENMAYLIKYDTVYGRYEQDVEAVDGSLPGSRAGSGRGACFRMHGLVHEAGRRQQANRGRGDVGYSLRTDGQRGRTDGRPRREPS